MKLHHLSLCVFLLAALSACTAAPPPKAASPHEQLVAEIGDAACDSNAQCRTVAVGHKACGGPSGFLAWSSKRSNEARINELAKAQAEAARKEQQAGGMMSNCALVLDPGASCKASRCELHAEKRGELSR